MKSEIKVEYAGIEKTYTYAEIYFLQECSDLVRRMNMLKIAKQEISYSDYYHDTVECARERALKRIKPRVKNVGALLRDKAIMDAIENDATYKKDIACIEKMSKDLCDIYDGERELEAELRKKVEKIHADSVVANIEKLKANASLLGLTFSEYLAFKKYCE